MELISAMDIYIDHQNKCWEQYNRFKDSKDKIVFFIGTLFIAVYFGSGFLIYKIADTVSTTDIALIFSKLYVVQYCITHLFFFLLYQYYAYNNVQEKIFLIEVQCCQKIIWDNCRIDSPEIPVPFSRLKKEYCDTISTKLKARSFKNKGNILLFIIYSVFTIIPVFFPNNCVFFKSISTSNCYIWLFKLITFPTILVVIFLAIISVDKSGRTIIKNVKSKIKNNWESVSFKNV